MNDEENIIGFDALYESATKCQKGVMWKGSVAHFMLNAPEEILKLSSQLKDGSYKSRKINRFKIYSPKERDIISISFRDRVYQRSLNDNVLYGTMTKSFISDNQACQVGKGTDRARNRLEEFFHKAYRHHGTDFYILQIDIHGYYANMSHEVNEANFIAKNNENIANRAIKVMRQQYTEEYGYNPGSQMIQIAGISYLDSIDHYIKEELKIKYYIRYMDDLILLHEDKEYLKYCQKKISEQLALIHLEFNPKKTKTHRAKDGVMFLGFRYRMTDTGKVLRLINPDNVKRERRKLKGLVRKCVRGEITKEKVDSCYTAWKAHASNGNTFKVIQRMDKYYKDLWRNYKMRYEPVSDPNALREQERAQAQASKNQANIDFLALMLDIDIDDEENMEGEENVESV